MSKKVKDNMVRSLTAYSTVLAVIEDYSNMINRNKKRLREYLINLEVMIRGRDSDRNPEGYIDYKSKEGIRIFSYKLTGRIVVTSQFIEDKFTNIDDRLYCSLVKDIISELYGLDIKDIG